LSWVRSPPRSYDDSVQEADNANATTTFLHDALAEHRGLYVGTQGQISAH
jgi:hypothetical protein